MKKIAWMLVLLMLLAFGMTFANADVLWIPEDEFFEEHQDECETLGRSYYTTKSLTLQVSPENDRKVETIKAGSYVYAQFSYTDEGNVKWGLNELENGRTGWFKLEDATLKYDHMSFMEDKAEQITEYEGELRAYEGDIAIYYTYPNSGEFFKGPANAETQYSYNYTDEAGKEWAYVSYFWGQDGWICQDDPNDESLDSARFVPPAIEPDSCPEDGCNTTLIWVVCVVVAVVALTAVLLVIFFRKKK